MPNNESLADRLNRLAREQRLEQDAETKVRATQEDVNQFILREARPEFERLKKLLEGRVEAVNDALKDLPEFEVIHNGECIRQGNVAAFLSFVQAFTNAGPVWLQLSFGREPERTYADFFSGPPEPKRYKLQPALERSPDRIVWVGDLGQLESHQVTDFILEQLTEYFLEHRIQRH